MPSNNRHSYVRFFPSDWMGGTARMSRLHRSVYHDICVYNWDKLAGVPTGELTLMLSDLPNGMLYVEELIDAGKLMRCDDGCVANPRAMAEAKHSQDLWERKSRGGAKGAAKTNAGTADGTPAGSHATERERERDEKGSPYGLPKKSRAAPGGVSESCFRIVEAYNTAAELVSLPKCKWPLTKGRDALVRARIKDHGFETVVAELRKIPHERRFLGGGDDQWRTDFGKLMRADTFTALMEGRYDRAKQSNNKSLIDDANEVLAGFNAMDERRERARAESADNGGAHQLALEGPGRDERES